MHPPASGLDAERLTAIVNAVENDVPFVPSEIRSANDTRKDCRRRSDSQSASEERLFAAARRGRGAATGVERSIAAAMTSMQSSEMSL